MRQRAGSDLREKWAVAPHNAALSSSGTKTAASQRRVTAECVECMAEGRVGSDVSSARIVSSGEEEEERARVWV